jgi:hypothetical protein
MACFLAACGTSALLSDKTCQAPCWRGITPGHSTYQETLAILSSLPEAKADSLTENHVDEHRSNIWLDFSPGVRELGVRIYFEDQIVLAIKFDIRGAVTAAQTIERTGKPEWVIAELGCADAPWLDVGLLNRTTGVYITYFDGYFLPGKRAEIQPGSPVSEVTYFEPSLFDKLLNSRIILQSMETPATFSSNLKPWSGYGEVSPVNICH